MSNKEIKNEKEIKTEKEIKEKVVATKSAEDVIIDKATEASNKASALAAMETVIKTEKAKAQIDSERKYVLNLRAKMLKKCKEDKKVTIVGDKLYAPILGKTYSYCFNTIPVTIKFDGTKQEFPEFIANDIRKRMYAAAESNTYKEVIVTLD